VADAAPLFGGGIRRRGDLDVVPPRSGQDPRNHLRRRRAGEDGRQTRRRRLARFLHEGHEIARRPNRYEQPADGGPRALERVEATARGMHAVPRTGRNGLAIHVEGEGAVQDVPALVLGEVAVRRRAGVAG
jgi:hypothetical protein